MLPPGASFGPSWSESLCLRKDNNFVPPRGHLSSSPRLDAILQALILFGPAAWLLVGTLVRFVQLRKTDLVVLPNRRGYLKIVSIYNGGMESILMPLFAIGANNYVLYS